MVFSDNHPARVSLLSSVQVDVLERITFAGNINASLLFAKIGNKVFCVLYVAARFLTVGFKSFIARYQVARFILTEASSGNL